MAGFTFIDYLSFEFLRFFFFSKHESNERFMIFDLQKKKRKPVSKYINNIFICYKIHSYNSNNNKESNDISNNKLI